MLQVRWKKRRCVLPIYLNHWISILIRNLRRSPWLAFGAMSADRATYIDSSAIVKLVMVEDDSMALRRYVVRQRKLVSSALARTEVGAHYCRWVFVPCHEGLMP